MRQYKDTFFTVSREGVVIGKKGKQLSERKDSKGYIRHSMKGKEFYVHQMVWDLYGDKSREGLDINHKNGIKTDNRIENLEAITRSENMRHAYALGLNKACRNDNHSKGILSDNQVVEIRELLAIGKSLRQIADKYDVHHSLIFRIKKGIKKLTTEI